MKKFLSQKHDYTIYALTYIISTFLHKISTQCVPVWISKPKNQQKEPQNDACKLKKFQYSTSSFNFKLKAEKRNDSLDES